MSLLTLMIAQFRCLSLHHEGNLTNYQPWTRGLMSLELNVLSAPPTPCYHAPKPASNASCSGIPMQTSYALIMSLYKTLGNI
ncbi:hypothetical protein SAMN04488142_2780 [Halomonas sp. hl-4]|nr:hypothetical protein SAMN04488142_2780 [Halomonas sp. hl-4]